MNAGNVIKRDCCYQKTKNNSKMTYYMYDVKFDLTEKPHIRRFAFILRRNVKLRYTCVI